MITWQWFMTTRVGFPYKGREYPSCNCWPTAAAAAFPYLRLTIAVGQEHPHFSRPLPQCHLPAIPSNPKLLSSSKTAGLGRLAACTKERERMRELRIRDYIGVVTKLPGSFRVLSPQHVDTTDADSVLSITAPANPGILTELLQVLNDWHNCGNRVADVLEGIQQTLVRLADHLAPEPENIVGTDYIAKRLDCTLVWVAEMVRKGDVPKHCIVPGTGNGKVWKFHRRRVDEWLNKR